MTNRAIEDQLEQSEASNDDAQWASELIVKHLRFLAEFEGAFGPIKALLEFGVVFDVDAQMPSWLKHGPPKECFANVTSVMLHRDDVFYVEGYAINLNVPVPIEHAWLVDAEGRVIDPTWRNAADHLYFGIAFNRETVEQAMASNDGDAGILSDWKLARQLCSSAEKFQECLAALSTSRIPRLG